MSARGEWLTILHDDDLINANFAREMMRKLDGDARQYFAGGATRSVARKGG
jgi:hypothetical protein